MESIGMRQRGNRSANYHTTLPISSSSVSPSWALNLTLHLSTCRRSSPFTHKQPMASGICSNSQRHVKNCHVVTWTQKASSEDRIEQKKRIFEMPVKQGPTVTKSRKKTFIRSWKWENAVIFNFWDIGNLSESLRFWNSWRFWSPKTKNR